MSEQSSLMTSGIQSMTGFGKGEVQSAEYVVSVEIKSVNHRFKDLRFKMASVLNSMEIELKQMLSDRFNRGSFDIYINFRRSAENQRFNDLDRDKIVQFIEYMKEIRQQTDLEMSLRPTDFLRPDFYRDQETDQYESLKPQVRQAFVLALDDLQKSRLQEGSKLVEVLQRHREQYHDFYRRIEGWTSLYQKSVEDKLRKRFDEMKVSMPMEEPRFMQEVVFYLEKLDVHEEINRIDSHLKKFDSLLVDSGEVGRQIDFLVQELNRETNTIGSKSGMLEISDAVVQMKVQLEKIREQALNLE